jgi:hypothetical protein
MSSTPSIPTSSLANINMPAITKANSLFMDEMIFAMERGDETEDNITWIKNLFNKYGRKATAQVLTEYNNQKVKLRV